MFVSLRDKGISGHVTVLSFGVSKLPPLIALDVPLSSLLVLPARFDASGGVVRRCLRATCVFARRAGRSGGLCRQPFCART